ncbi:MAG: hypothetical protein JWQ25_1864 [Daejeonella sp.]|nr:hypothetical protein [Daejeonella sp.]
MKHFATRNSLNKVCCTTIHDEDNNWIFSDWIGFIREEDIKNWSLPFLEMIKQTNCQNFLNSNLEVQSTWQNANPWIVAELIPKVIEAGLKNYAHIIPSQLFGQLTAKDLESKIKDTNFTMKIFEDIDSAQRWLRIV